MGGRRRVVVVGAGLSGLLAARELAGDHDVVVLDKGRGVGGRMATRRIGGATFDHGAQFLTARSATMRALVEEWRRAGLVVSWLGGPDGHLRLRGAPSMTSPAKALAATLDVRCATRVESVAQDRRGWAVRVEGGGRLDADAVLMTAPVPQTTEMIRRGEVPIGAADQRVLDAVRYEPCLAVLAPLEGPSGLPAPGLVQVGGGVVDVVSDNQLKGVSAAPALTVHATAAASEAMWDRSDDEVASSLLAAVDVEAAARAELVQVVRWRYARSAGPTDRSHLHLHLDGDAPLVVAGDGFGGPSLEGAALSGLSAAAELSELLRS